jgi:hypothetical protein
MTLYFSYENKVRELFSSRFRVLELRAIMVRGTGGITWRIIAFL